MNWIGSDGGSYSCLQGPLRSLPRPPFQPKTRSAKRAQGSAPPAPPAPPAPALPGTATAAPPISEPTASDLAAEAEAVSAELAAENFGTLEARRGARQGARGGGGARRGFELRAGMRACLCRVDVDPAEAEARDAAPSRRELPHDQRAPPKETAGPAAVAAPEAPADAPEDTLKSKRRATTHATTRDDAAEAYALISLIRMSIHRTRAICIAV